MIIIPLDQSLLPNHTTTSHGFSVDGWEKLVCLNLGEGDENLSIVFDVRV
jgi:hypothetical protein